MSKVSGRLFPRGFIFPVAGGTVVPDQGHRDVDRLLDYLFSGKVNNKGFSFYREVFPVAMSLFGDFPTFLRTQKNNPFLYGYNYEFLLDTLKFIQTGCRKVSIHNWKPLLAEWAEPHSDHRQRASSGQLDKLTRYSGVEIVAQWCSHPGGFDDMVMTMGLMFGSSFEEDQTESTINRIKKLNQLFA